MSSVAPESFSPTSTRNPALPLSSLLIVAPGPRLVLTPRLFLFPHRLGTLLANSLYRCAVEQYVRSGSGRDPRSRTGLTPPWEALGRRRIANSHLLGRQAVGGDFGTRF